MDIEEIRKNIDSIDQEILSLVSKRFALIDGVLKYKLGRDLPIRDENREKEILINKMDQAVLLGINPNFVESLFKGIIKESVRIQEEGLRKLKENGKK